MVVTPRQGNVRDGALGPSVATSSPSFDKELRSTVAIALYRLFEKEIRLRNMERLLMVDLANHLNRSEGYLCAPGIWHSTGRWRTLYPGLHVTPLM